MKKNILFNYPKIMGILNITTNSFYDGGKYLYIKNALMHIEKMIKDGVDIIDIGACASNPYVEIISLEEEKKRLLPLFNYISRDFNNKVLFSIDTFRYQIANIAINHGFTIINDISGGKINNKIFTIINSKNIIYVLMHIYDNVYNIHKYNVLYKKNFIMKKIISFFKNKISILNSHGVNKIILDPGIGFNKNNIFDIEIISKISNIKQFNFPIMIGISRKSILKKILHYKKCENLLNATTSLNMIALINGASILRVHDVKEAVECKKIFLKIFKYTK